MRLADMLLSEFDQEMASTRKTLERLPEDKFGWKPHEKSFSMDALATHLATIPSWAVESLTKDSLDLNPTGEPPTRQPPAASVAELLEKFDGHVAAAREAIAGASDEKFGEPWSLLMTGTTLFTMPRMAVLRTFVMNHLIHHRAQLGVYLRLNDVPVPSVYGPSADEQTF